MTEKPYRKYPPDAPSWSPIAKLLALVLAVYLADAAYRHF